MSIAAPSGASTWQPRRQITFNITCRKPGQQKDPPTRCWQVFAFRSNRTRQLGIIEDVAIEVALVLVSPEVGARRISLRGQVIGIHPYVFGEDRFSMSVRERAVAALQVAVGDEVVAVDCVNERHAV